MTESIHEVADWIFEPAEVVYEVAAAIFFLCGPDSSYISGAEIEVNGAQHV